MAWPPQQHITSYRNVFHCAQFASHRTASHRNVVHRIDSLCMHSLSLRTVWQRKALDRIASPRLVSPTHSIARASHLITSNRLALPHIISFRFEIASHRIASYPIRTVWQRSALDRIASHHIIPPTHSIASHRIAYHCPCIASYHTALPCSLHATNKNENVKKS